MTECETFLKHAVGCPARRREGAQFCYGGRQTTVERSPSVQHFSVVPGKRLARTLLPNAGQVLWKGRCSNLREYKFEDSLSGII